MSTTDRIVHNRWWLPAVSLVLGVIMLAAFAIGGDTSGGVQSFAVMAVLALVFASAPRGPRRWAASAARAQSR